MQFRPAALVTAWAIFSAAPVSRADGQDAYWQQTSAPASDYVTSVAFDSSGNEYAATVYGGVFRSTDAGAHWTRVNAGLPDYFVSALAGLQDTSMLAGAPEGIYPSRDPGLGWGVKTGSGESPGAATEITVDGSGRIFVATSSSGIYRSSDAGAHWSKSSIGLTDSTMTFIRVKKNNELFAGTQSAGVFRSTDSGDSWSPVGHIGFTVSSLVEDSTGHLAAGTIGGGIIQSTDDGASWSPAGLAGGHVNALALTSRGWVLAATDSGLYSSQNPGGYWSLIGFAGTRFTCIDAFRSGQVLAGTERDGLIWSNDGGSTWSLPYNGMTLIAAHALLWTKSGVLLAATSEAIFRSTNNGATWAQSGATWAQSRAGLMTSEVRALAEGDNGWVYAGTRDSGLYLSKDEGVSWEHYGHGNMFIRSLAFNRAGELMAAAGPVYVIRKGDSVWTQYNLPISIQFSEVLGVDSAGTVYAGADTGGVFISSDSGRTWHTSGLPGYPANALTISARQHILAGNYSGRIFRSTNSGLSWGLAFTGLPPCSVNFLATHPNGTLFAGITGFDGGALYTSTDDGDHWSPLGSAVSNAGVTSLVTGKNGYLFIGTAGAGVLVSAQPFTSIGANRTSPPAMFALSQNFPNPFNPATIIRYALPGRAHASLIVYNMLGQRVATLVDAMEEAGNHEVKFDGTRLASGVYFYMLHAGDYLKTMKLLLIR